MKFILHKKTKIFFNYFLVPILFIWLGFNLYNEIVHQENKAKAWQDIQNAFIGEKSWEIYLASILMLANWGIEALKWKMLMSPLQKVSFHQAFKAILAGTSFAANTPNRVGEYFGRMIYIEEGKRLQSVALTIAGSFSQVLVTLICGTIGLFFYSHLSAKVENPTISGFWLNVAGIGSLLVSLICTMLYFKMSWLVTALTKIPFIARYEFFFQKINELNTNILLKALLFSMLRYLVFILQYILVLHAFGVEGTVGNYVVLISVLFLVLTIVPSFVIIEAGIRSTVSVEIFKVVSTNSAAIFATSTFIWLINLMLPALIGVILLIGKRVFRR